ncbi:MAG: outer membrane beta-barrel protein [Alcanivoracaceae bacterium]|jgi:hypothetical protein|nr:outer membrane beta-barrel protein [Alcanivoracaceae bacterium]
MKRLLLPLLLSLPSLPVHAYEYEPDLKAPDVTIYGELHGVRSDFGGYGGEDESGFRGRLGMEFNDNGPGRWRWRVEGGLNQFGEANFDYERTEAGSFGIPGVVSRTTTTSESVRLTGFEFGARLYDNELFYVRAGAFVYNMKVERDVLITDRDASDAIVGTPFSLTPDSESNSGVSPYVGAGLEFPLFDESFRLIAEYNLYRVEQEKFDNIAVGAQFRF